MDKFTTRQRTTTAERVRGQVEKFNLCEGEVDKWMDGVASRLERGERRKVNRNDGDHY